MSDKKTIATYRPTPMSGVVAIITGFLFLVFGLAFWYSVKGEMGNGALLISIFFIIWTLFCLGFIAYGIVILKSLPKKDRKDIPIVSGAYVEITSRDEEDGEAGGRAAEGRGWGSSPAGDIGGQSGDFETRLRKLDALKKDCLITEEEYLRKRREILKEKW